MQLSKFQIGPASVLVVILFAVGGLGYWTASGAKRQAAQFRENTLRKLGYSAELNSFQAEGYARFLWAVATDDPQKRVAYQAEGQEFRTKIDNILRRYDEAIPLDQVKERRVFNNFVETRKRYREVVTQIMKLLEAGQVAEARRLVDPLLMTAYRDYMTAGDALYDYGIATGERQAENLERVCAKARFITASICIGVFLAGLLMQFIVFLFTRSLLSD
jgi:hypothetical protein